VKIFIYVWLSLSAAGLVLAGAPTNDAFVNRTRLSGVAFVINADNTDATLEEGEPGHTGFGQNSLWWSWTAPVDGVLTVSAGGDIFHGFDVWTGDTLATLTAVDTITPQCPLRDSGSPAQFRVVANREYQIAFSSLSSPRPFQLSLVFGTIEVMSPGNGSVAFKAPQIPVEVSLNDTVERISKIWIELNGTALDLLPASSDRTTGKYTFLLPIPLAGLYNVQAKLLKVDGIVNSSPIVSVSVVQPNDDFANAVTLTGSSISVAGDVAFATSEVGEIVNPDSDGGTIWYRWVAPVTGIARLTTSNSGILASVQRRTPSGTNEILATNPVVESEHHISSRQTLQFAAQASAEYFIQFSGIRQPNFEFPFLEQCEPPPPPTAIGFNFALSVDSASLGQSDIFLANANSTHPDSVLFVFAAAPNSAIQIRSSTNLADWQVVFEGTATGGSEAIYIPADLNARQRFYNVELQR
jgi:hypothetical protein